MSAPTTPPLPILYEHLLDQQSKAFMEEVRFASANELGSRPSCLGLLLGDPWCLGDGLNVLRRPLCFTLHL